MLLIVTIVVALLATVVQGYYECQPGTVVLDLTNTYLGVFPNVTTCATSLQKLYLSGTGLSVIPPEIGELGSLLELRVEDNQLTALPNAIGSLTNLREMWASGNSISGLPSTFSNLMWLRNLRLSRNSFSEVPPAIFNLNLQELHMESNPMTAVPRELGNMHNLVGAKFSYNPISSLPAELGGWWSLEWLELWGTLVQCLPRSMTKLQNFGYGNYYPTCTNDTIAGYVVQRVRNKNTCSGPVRNVNGTAFGCLDYVHSTCEELDGEVVVTKRFLSDLDSRGLRCEANATVQREVVTIHQRCSAETGVATSCSDLESSEVPYPHAHAGMVTLNYPDFDKCDKKHDDTDFGRRLTEAASSVAAPAETAMSFDVQVAPSAVPKIVMPRDHFRVRPTEREVTALKATLEAKRKADLEAVEREFKSRVAKQVQSVCDQYTTVLYVTAPANNTNLANCTSLRELVISNFDPAVVAALVPQLAGLQTLRLLSFGGTPITLPENLDQLHNLRTLDVRMSYVQGDTMPEVLRRMTGLTSLTYNELGWSTFVVPGWLSELTQLTTLDLSRNRFYGDWPMPVFQLYNLRNLTMSNAYLWRAIPEEITHLKQLDRLDLSENYNGDSPAFLGRLTSLQHLRMNNNYIRSIPSTWGHLVNLRSLMLFGNQITCLPESVRSLPNIGSNLWQVLSYPACPDAPLPLSFNQARNTACLWDPYYEFWYRAACDAQADTLSVTLYADSACRKKAKRRALHSLDAIYPHLGYCKPSFVSAGGNTTATPAAYVIQYCQS